MSRVMFPETHPSEADTDRHRSGADMGAPLLVITPCRDEARFATRTLDSVIAQTVRPDRWVIVDDGSTDGTAEIIADYAARHPFIELVRRPDRGKRSVGPGVIAAFGYGLESVDLAPFEFLCKLDLDLDLPPRYFEILIGRMRTDPQLGSCSGKPYFHDDAGELVSEKIGDEMSTGASKFYRIDCFREIGGFVPFVMWDGIDVHRSRMLGWHVRSWDEPELRFLHLRPMGSSDRGWMRGRVRHGEGQFFMGTSLPYMTASAVYRMTRPPYVIGGLAMWYGFVRSWIARRPRYEDSDFRRFLRRFQWQSLLLGKRRAMQRAERSSIAK